MYFSTKNFLKVNCATGKERKKGSTEKEEERECVKYREKERKGEREGQNSWMVLSKLD